MSVHLFAIIYSYLNNTNQKKGKPLSLTFQNHFDSAPSDLSQFPSSDLKRESLNLPKWKTTLEIQKIEKPAFLAGLSVIVSLMTSPRR